MATWTKNQPRGSNGRRRWHVEDRNSLNNLKYHIAAEGCSDVQYELAKQLLETSIEAENRGTVREQAVHWLMRACQQGHDDAVVLLQQCYDEDCGITADNEAEVRACLSMTAGERAARKAARELFACLSNGGSHITPRQLEKKMREIYKMQKRQRRYGGGSSTSTSEDEEGNNDGQRPSIEQRQSQSPSSPSQEQTLQDPASPLHRRGSSSMNCYLNSVSSPEQRHHHSHHSHRRIERITEENLVSAAAFYSAGRMPAVSDALTLSVPHPEALDHVPCFHRLLFHPVLFLTLLYHRLINMIIGIPSSMSFHVLMALLPILIYALIYMSNAMIFATVCLYYLCWTVMIWSTCKMLKTKQDFIDFRIWSGLFLSYGDQNIETDTSESRFLKNNMYPYLYFFMAFTGNLILYPGLIGSEWLPYSEMTILAGLFTFASLITFIYCSPISTHSSTANWFVLLSFGINVLAKYPYEMDDVVTNGWRFLDLKVPTFSSFVIGNGIEFCLNCRTALYLLIPIVLIQLAKLSNWRGVYTHLIPHCVTLSWLQLCIMSAQSATMFGMIRSTLGLAGILLFLPLFGLLSLLIPVFVAIEWLGFTDRNVRLGSTVFASMIAILISCILAINRTTRKYITFSQVLLCLIAACILTYPYMTSDFKDGNRKRILTTDHHHSRTSSSTPSPDNEMLSWQRFYEYCGPPAWKYNNRIATQLKCSHLEGLAVAWEGEVIQIQISNVRNLPAYYIHNYLPEWLAKWISCSLSEKRKSGTDEDDDPEPNVMIDECLMSSESVVGSTEEESVVGSSSSSSSSSSSAGRRLKSERCCSLNKWNTYEYEINVRMSSTGLLSKGVEILLLASHRFGNFTQRLAQGDRIHFYGFLMNGGGGGGSGGLHHHHHHPGRESGFHRHEQTYKDKRYLLGGGERTMIRLAAIECVECLDTSIKPVILENLLISVLDARIRDLKRGIKFLLNVLFNPLITFK